MLKKDILNIFIIFCLLMLVFFFGLVRYSPLISTGIIAAIAVFIISFVKIELGLIFLIVAMLFSPEISLGALLDRNIVVRLEDILIPILLLVWLGRIATGRDSRLLAKNPLNIPILCYIIICILSIARGMTIGSIIRPEVSMFYLLKTMEFFFIYFIVVNFVKTPKHVRYFLTAALTAALAISLYALYQVPKVQVWTLHRITAPFEGSPEPATMGGYLTIILAISLSLFIYTRTPLQKWVYGSLSILIIIPLLYTLSRVSYLSSLFMLFVLSVFTKRKTLIFFLIIFLLLSPIILPQKIWDRVTYTLRDARDMGVDPSTEERIVIWRNALDTLMKRPFLGFGIATWNILDNQYVRTIIEVGLIGLLAFLWIIFRIYKCSVILFHRTKEWWIKAFSVGYIAALSGMLVHSLGTITFYIVRIMEPFWFLTGLIMVLYRNESERKDVGIC